MLYILIPFFKLTDKLQKVYKIVNICIQRQPSLKRVIPFNLLQIIIIMSAERRPLLDKAVCINRSRAVQMILIGINLQ